jgi:hypothetical protein
MRPITSAVERLHARGFKVRRDKTRPVFGLRAQLAFNPRNRSMRFL